MEIAIPGDLAGMKFCIVEKLTEECLEISL